MLMTDPKARAKRIEEKRKATLRFLRTEIWSTAEILGTVMGVVSRQGVHSSLVKLEDNKMIKRHSINVGAGRKLTLWGITPHGQAFAWDEEEEMENFPVFEPSRVALSSIPHHLDIQLARIKAEAEGWKNWVTCDRGDFFKNSPSIHRPDALITSPDGVVVAIEVERTIKTRKRYQQVLAGHLKAMASKHWGAVYYITPQDMAKRLKKVIYSITTIPVNGSAVQLEVKHLERFIFVDLADWPSKGEN